MKPKIVSVLALIAAVSTAIATQVADLNPRAGAWVLLIAGVAAAAGGTVSKLLDASRGAVFLGLIVSVTGAMAMSQGLFSPKLMSIFSILGIAAAAAGKSLFGWEGKPENVIGSRINTFL